MFFAYLKVPLAQASGEAADALHRTLDGELAATGAGTLLGWGTSLPSADAREDDPGCFHRIDIGLREPAALEALRPALLGLGLAEGTRLHFNVDGVAMHQTLAGDGWGAAVKTRDVHR
ncbi:hypothetical protein [Arenimonas composti]|uniref:Uncharacterized protein n=1 Tax=Arenimonas composti TR7-09 = DSM 18010 TaxID=1121013 RepID=A0A091BA51_9GAMM|nr:hypothetical protein [Arenimonas composti]KFN49518.1 hypothetical protein P873_10210 [Arenimonas composti TR7-09 = DSM 18010]